MSDEINKLNISNIEKWRKGDPVSAKKLNQTVDAVKSSGTPSLPIQVPDQLDRYEVRMFRVVRLEKDVIVCVYTDGVTDQEDEIKVAMPYLCRQTPFDSAEIPAPDLRRGKKYTYTFTDDDTGLPRYDKRTSIDTENDDDEEIQVITPYYSENDLIYASRGMFGNTGVFHDDAKEQPVVWLDVNDDGRAYALSAEDEPEEE